VATADGTSARAIRRGVWKLSPRPLARHGGSDLLGCRRRQQYARNDDRCDLTNPRAAELFCLWANLLQGEDRFCSPRYRIAFDGGFPPYSRAPISTGVQWHVVAGRPVLIPRDFSTRGDGCMIACEGCQRGFVSRGLRCCSVECERKHKQQLEIAAAVAEVGLEIAPKRKCEACGGAIPRWRAGKAVRKTTRFCSKKCSKRASKVSYAFDPVLGPEGAKKSLQNGPLFNAAA
jgi:hypothetical protein